MSKYDALWAHIARQPGPTLLMTWEEISQAGGAALDHSFLSCKKELTALGWQVKKISMKQQTVLFEKME